MSDKLDRLNDIRVENFVWIIYIGIIILSFIANAKEKEYFLTNNEQSRREYQALLIIIFVILIFIYFYFYKDSYDDMKKLKPTDSDKKKILVSLSYLGSLLILVSGAIFLIIAISDENIDTEIAFS